MPTYKATTPPPNAGNGGSGPKKTYPTIPNGTELDATVIEVKERIAPFRDKVTQEPVKLTEYTFEVRHGDQDRRVWGEARADEWYPGSKHWSWVQEMLAQDLPDDFTLNTDHLEQTRCRIVVGVRNYTDKEGTPRERNFVRDVKRSRSAAPVYTPPAKPEYSEEPF